MSSTGQLSMVIFIFLNEFCVLVLLVPLDLDLFLFIALLCSAMYETKKIANICNLTHKRRSMVDKSRYFSVCTCTCLLRFFTFHDSYSKNRTHFNRYVDNVRMPNIHQKLFHTTTCTCIYFIHN